MTVTARKYNPGFLSEDELIASFCVRSGELGSLVEVLRECRGNANAHQIVIGPRGSGKTSVLLRVAAEIRRDADLSSRFFPVVFAEESYEVASAGEFWLECLSRIAGQSDRGPDDPGLQRTYEELRSVYEDRTLGERCLGALQDFSDRQGKRLVLIVENLNMMFRDMVDAEAGWKLRHTLQTEARIVLLASATSRFDEIDDPERALYDLFRVLVLRPLDEADSATLWRNVSGQDRARQTIRALQILTGGSPRLLTIMARFGANLSFRELMADLLDLVDDHTEYFKSHLEALAQQERRVYLALADLWKPATAREIADRARLETSKCSAQLNRLVDRGIVEVTGGTARRKLYYLAERLYNIYYLMRRARGPAPMIEALIRFMEAYYSPSELKVLGARMALEAAGFDARTQLLYRTAFDKLVELPSLAAHRDELRSLLPAAFSGLTDDGQPDSAASASQTKEGELINKGVELARKGRLREALAAWDEVVQRHGASSEQADLDQVALALINSVKALDGLGRHDEVFAVCDDIVRRFGLSNAPRQVSAAAMALVSKGGLLGLLGRPQAALEAWNEAVRRYGGRDEPLIRNVVVMALNGMGAAYHQIGRSKDAVAAWEKVTPMFREGDGPEIAMLVLGSLVDRGTLLVQMNRPTEALEAWDEALERFANSDQPGVLVRVAEVLVNKGTLLRQLGRMDEALTSWNEVVLRFGTDDQPVFAMPVLAALVSRAGTFFEAGRAEEGLGVHSELIGRFGSSDEPAVIDLVANSFVNMGAFLARSNRLHEAMEAWDEVLARGGTGSGGISPQVVAAMGNKAHALERLNRPTDAVVMWGELADRFMNGDAAEFLGAAAHALIRKGTLLHNLNRLQEALDVWDEVVRRFDCRDEALLVDAVCVALADKGGTLIEMGRVEEALAVWGDVVCRFGEREGENFRQAVSSSLVNMASALVRLDRQEEGLAILDRAVGEFGPDSALAVQEQVATAFLNRGSLLAGLKRPDEALAAWEESVRRFGMSEAPALQDSMAMCLVNKGFVLTGLDRHEEALAACEEVVKRFGDSDRQWQFDAVAKALLQKCAVLAMLGRHEEALEACEETVARFGPDSRVELPELVAAALVNKSTVLVGLERPEEALAALQEVIRCFSSGQTPALRNSVESAVLKKAEIELALGRAGDVIEGMNGLLEKQAGGSVNNRWEGHFIRALAYLETGDRTACARDIDAVLALTPELSSFPREAIDALAGLAVDLGIREMRDLIRTSPAADLLLPLTTALARELGEEPRVAREIEEVAEDIRRELAERRLGEAV